MDTFGPFNNFDGLAPTTTKGDVIARDTNTNVRIPVGADGTFLQASAGVTGGVTWAAPAAMPIKTLVGATTLPASAQRVFLSGTTFAVTLPSAASNSGLEFEIIKADAAVTTQSVSGTGFVGVTLVTQGEKYSIICDGTTFWPTNHSMSSSATLIASADLTIRGFGTIGGASTTAFWSRTGSIMNFQGRLMAGTVSGSTSGFVAFPSGFVAAGSSLYPTGANCIVGVGGANVSQYGSFALTRAGSTGILFAGINGSNPLNGSGDVGASLATTNNNFSWSANIHMSGWGS